MARREYLTTIGGGLSTHNLQAPAKINLFLAVTGRRQDGYHDLVSLAVPLVWGDSVGVEAADSSFSVACDSPDVPTDRTNLVVRAAEAFAAATGWAGGARFTISKRVPAGAGLGGASSDAVAALEGLNAIAGRPLDSAGMARVASSVGSDCALFLASGPVVMRGRGERIEALPREPYGRIRGMRVLIFKPGFSVSTPWAYARLAEGAPRSYTGPERAEALLESWILKSGAPPWDLYFNSFERPVFAKFGALPIVLERLRDRFGIEARMSGSGSACFALLNENADAGPAVAAIREAWGASAFVAETRVA
jgi:4-diphosphocytidyl-2-C-methyl-D-erythritol kinase